MPAFSEILLSFAVLVGSMGALLSLNRKSELIVMRSAGMSAWQFVGAGAVVVLLIGVADITLYNPIAAAAYSEAERRMAKTLGTGTGLLTATTDGSWLRQDGADGQSVVNTRAVADQGRTLAQVVVYQFDSSGRFLERIDADRATLQDGFWEMTKGVVSRPGREPEPFDTYQLSTYIASEQLTEAFGSEIAVSIWQLPALIASSERAGIEASRHRMQYAVLLSRPLLLVTIVLLASTVSLRSFRSGGIQRLIVTGMVAGIGFYLLAESFRQFGIAGAIPPTGAVGVPIVVGLLIAATVLLHQEDG